MVARRRTSRRALWGRSVRTVRAAPEFEGNEGVAFCVAARRILAR